MKLALYLPNFRDKVTVKELEDLTALAEELDFDSVWTLDRIVVPEASDREELAALVRHDGRVPEGTAGVRPRRVVPGLAADPVARREDVEGADRHEHHRHAVPRPRRPRRRARHQSTTCRTAGSTSASAPAGCPRSSPRRAPRTSSRSGTSTCARRSRSCRASGRTTCSSTTASSPTSTAAGSARSRCRSPHPPIFFSGLKDPKRSAEPHRQVRPVGLDRHPGHAGGARRVARRDRARARRARQCPLRRRPRHVQHDLVRHHRRGDRPDAEPGKVTNLLAGTAAQITDNLKRYKEAGLDDAAAVAAVRRRAGLQDARRPQAAEGRDHAEGRRDVIARADGQRTRPQSSAR